MNVSFSTEIINSLDLLYGRSESVARLVSYANRGDNVFVIGARRFGKTSLLRTVISEIRKEISSSTVYPIYMNLQNDEIQEEEEAYIYMISKMIGSLFEDGFFKEQWVKYGVTISPDTYLSIYEEIVNYKKSKRILSGILSDLIDEYSQRIEKTILFVIDEYEHLHKVSDNKPTIYATLRRCDDLERSDKGIKPFALWIAGVGEWTKYCRNGGSPELNFVTIQEHVTPIDKQSFDKMWNDECLRIEDKVLRQKLLESCHQAYISTGGVPFFAKKYGTEMITYGIEPNYTSFRNFLESILEINKEASKILYLLTKGKQSLELSDSVHFLLDFGLIKQSNNIFTISIGFLSDYIRNIDSDKNNHDEVSCLGGEIEDIIANINQNSKSDIFITPDTTQDYEILKTIVNNDKEFKIFISIVEHIVFEWTKADGIDQKNLPDCFKHVKFTNNLLALKNAHGMSHYTRTYQPKPNQIPPEAATTYFKGDSVWPLEKDEFRNLQLNILSHLRTYLGVYRLLYVENNQLMNQECYIVKKGEDTIIESDYISCSPNKAKNIAEFNDGDMLICDIKISDGKAVAFNFRKKV